MSYNPRAFVGHHIENRKAWGRYLELQQRIRRDDADMVAALIVSVHALIPDRRYGDSHDFRPCNAETSENDL